MDPKDTDAKTERAAKQGFMTTVSAKVAKVADTISIKATDLGGDLEAMAIQGEHRVAVAAEKASVVMKDLASKVASSAGQTLEKAARTAKDAAKQVSRRAQQVQYAATRRQHRITGQHQGRGR
jgi:hypothetical protein